MKGVIVIAVVNAQTNVFPAGSCGGQEAGAQGFQQQPGGAHRRDLVVGQQGKVEGHIIKGQGAVLPVHRALDPGDAVGFRDGKPDIALFVCREQFGAYRCVHYVKQDVTGCPSVGSLE